MKLSEASKVLKGTKVNRKASTKLDAKVLKVRDLIMKKFYLQGLVGNDRIVELSMAAKLATQYSDINFWHYFNLSWKIDSLKYFMSRVGQLELSRQYKKYKYNPHKDFVEPPVDDGYKEYQKGISVKTKPKSIHDFMEL